MEGYDIPASGHSTSDALRILYDEAKAELRVHSQYQARCTRQSNWKQRFERHFLHHDNRHSALHWTSLVFLNVGALLQFVAYGFQQSRDTDTLVEGLVLSFLAITAAVIFWQNNQFREQEMHTRIQEELERLKDCSDRQTWESCYINLHAPLAPSVSLQWTYRDGVLVNMPAVLLVEGDAILLRPGQVIPANCKPMHQDSDDSRETELFKRGDTYQPDLDDPLEPFIQPQARQPLEPKLCILTETPFLTTLRMYLEQACDRPASVLQNELYQTYFVLVERRLLPALLVTSLAINTIRLILSGRLVGHWTDMLITLQVHTVLPLLGLVFPLLWLALDLYGTARVLATFQRSQIVQDERSSTDGGDFDSASEIVDSDVMTLNWRDILSQFKELLHGPAGSLPRTSNITHALGNVTSLCCVDKKGLLSWPNPTSEKVFFFRPRKTTPEKLQKNSQDSKLDEVTEEQPTDEKQPAVTVSDNTQLVAQVLDVTHNAKNGKSLMFDDVKWKKYLASLKPLGLNILLNACNEKTWEAYTRFADHVTCAALTRKDITVPVVNRRCFCELSRQIGFSGVAHSIFEHDQTLGAFRQVPRIATSQQENHFRAKSFIKHRTPMPNMFSVVVDEANTGMLQLMSQGTGDLIMDACSDLWDGQTIRPLTDSERKKIYDFYHRSSMAAYCTAFAYRPLTEVLGEEFCDLYLELPEDMQEIYHLLKSPEPRRSIDALSLDQAALKSLQQAHCGSADSVIQGNSVTSVHDTEGCFRAQSNQVFIGMVTMQYQAKQDVVKLIEEMEQACIRFVHFSKENELRSRVFSEKMGLEAGWNCHISLLGTAGDMEVVSSAADLQGCVQPSSRFSSRFSSESMTRSSRNQSACRMYEIQELQRCRRLSAPGAISTDLMQVKFDLLDSARESPRRSLERDDHESGSHLDTSAGLVNSRAVSPLVHDQPEFYHTDSAPTPHVHNHHEHANKRTSGDLEEQDGKDVTSPLLRKLSKSHRPPSSDMGRESSPSDTRATPDRQHLSSISSSESYPASSYLSENTDSVTGALGLSNRAKLPKGIENIRPHINNVDNVPLLVSLFTDCTPATTREMLLILQEYGEVVCCVGSSANCLNTGVFLQADCSIAIEPLYPEVCSRSPSLTEMWDQAFLGPLDLAGHLQSIPCCLAFHRHDNISITELIAQARHHIISMRMTFAFYLMCSLCISILQLLSSVFTLPPILSTHHLLWLLLLVIPSISLTLMGNPVHLKVMTLAQSKNKDHVCGKMVLAFIGYFSAKFLPSVLICLFCHGLTLNHFCGISSPANTSCSMFSSTRENATLGTWNDWKGDHSLGLAISQSFVMTQLVIYLLCICMCHIHRYSHLWDKHPFKNKLWCIITPIIFVSQLVFCAVDIAIKTSCSGHRFQYTLADIHIAVWVVAVIWPILLIPLSELVKSREIKLAVRFQKRARLDFGTKLGMNSPF